MIVAFWLLQKFEALLLTCNFLAKGQLILDRFLLLLPFLPLNHFWQTQLARVWLSA